MLQLGTLALVPYAGQLILELGVIKMALMLFQQIMTGSLLFYMFQQMTVSLLPCPTLSALTCSAFPTQHSLRSHSRAD